MRLKDFIYYNRSDRRVLTFGIAFAVIAIAAICFLSGGDAFTEAGSNDSARIARRDGYSYPGYKDRFGKSKGNDYYAVESRRVSRFPFDPNTADSTALLSLGLQPWQVRNIYKYRAAGGIYRQPEDFARVYGLTKKQFDELRPYIRISSDYKPSSEFYESRHSNVNAPESIAARHITVKLRAGETLELNGADSSQLVRVPGIGPFYARQIENRRRWLGGYYSADQLLEIDYFPKEALNYFHVNASLIKKINVNKLSLSELKRHPYLNYYQAKAIVDYRRLRGPLKDIGELKLMKDFTEKDIERLRHYVEY